MELRRITSKNDQLAAKLAMIAVLFLTGIPRLEAP